MLDRHHGVLEAMAEALVIMHVAGSHNPYVQPFGKLRQALDASFITAHQVPLQLHEERARAKEIPQSTRRRLRLA